MLTRDQLTKQLVNSMPEDHAITVELATKTWWVNRRTNGGFRLTYAGYQALASVLDVESWTIELPPVQTRVLLVLQALDHKLTGPYFLTTKGHLVLFNSQDAVLYQLYQNFDRWLNSLPARPARPAV